MTSSLDAVLPHGYQCVRYGANARPTLALENGEPIRFSHGINDARGNPVFWYVDGAESPHG